MMNLKLSTVTFMAIGAISLAGWFWLFARLALKLF
jgi:hypothetical protein